MSPDSSPSPLERLERALELCRRRVEAGAPDPETLLAQHPDLRELLEPLLREDEDEDPGESGPAGVPAADQRVGDFRLLRELGRGGMGVVYEAEQASLGRRVALKLLPPERLDARSLARFKREALAGGRLDHPAVVSVIACGEDQGRHWIAMELVGAGRTLEDLVEEARRRPGLDARYYRDVAAIVAELADALARAHAAGIVHRDVKPGNVLLTLDGRPKLADFGLARLADSLTISRSGAFLGTPFYMSPEQAAGGSDEEVGPASDQFSLGATLYEALTLRRPFEGDSSQHVLRSVREEDPVDPAKLHRQLPRELAAICMKALEKEPRRRYASCAAFAADLRAFLEGRPVEARPPGAVDRARKWLRRNRGLAAAAGLLLLFLAVLAGTLVVIQDSWAEAEKSNARYERLADESRLREHVERANELGPGLPENVLALERWLEEAEDLESRAPRHAADLAALRDAGLESEGDGWLAERLQELLDELEVLARPRGLLERIAERHAFAQRVLELSVTGEEPARRWAAALARIADPTGRYGGLELQPQLGLLPLGPDPQSGLEEFAHLASGEVPRRDAAGVLELDEECGIVLVLLPGGECWLGAQAADTQGIHYDPLADALEGPPVQVRLDPFFIARHELTQAQWLRATAENPSAYRPDADPSYWITPMNPVEQVRWSEAVATLAALDLVLPTIARWEYAARGGTTTPWWTGERCESLLGAANLADAPAGATVVPWADKGACGPRFDGFYAHAPVHFLCPNPYGLHHVLGNVAEWVLDDYRPLERKFVDGDGRVQNPSDGWRRHAGSAMFNHAEAARVTGSQAEDPDFFRGGIGLRAARSLDTR